MPITEKVFAKGGLNWTNSSISTERSKLLFRGTKLKKMCNENNLLTSHNKTSKNIQSKKDKKSIFFAKKTKKLIEGKTIKKIENSKEIIVYNAKNNDSENFFTNIKNFCKSIVELNLR